MKKTNKRNNKGNSSNTKIEVLLKKYFWSRGYRYKKNNRNILGKPDLTFDKYKIAIFADGDFWHGKDWDIKKHEIKSNKEFWLNKIENNMQRDKMVTDKLREQGWFVFRFWETEINNDIDKCASKVIEKMMVIKDNMK